MDRRKILSEKIFLPHCMLSRMLLPASTSAFPQQFSPKHPRRFPQNATHSKSGPVVIFTVELILCVSVCVSMLFLTLSRMKLFVVCWFTYIVSVKICLLSTTY